MSAGAGNKTCAEAKCGPEAACYKNSTGFFSCICPHDFSAPVGGKCPRIVGDPATIPSLIIRNATKVTKGRAASPNLDDYGLVIAWSIAACLTVIGLVALVLMLLRRRTNSCWTMGGASSATSKQESYRIVSLTKTPLMDSRFQINIHYCSVDFPDREETSLAKVPLLHPEAVVLLKEIGEGCFGKVYKGLLKDPGRSEDTKGDIVAVKVLKESASGLDKDDFYREAEIMASFQHENILALRGLVLPENEGMPWILFEFMPFGDLAQLLRDNDEKNSSEPPLRLFQRDLENVAEQIAAGMLHLSSHHFVHRDLACRNCLVGRDLVVKISDFGMTRDVYTCDYYKVGGSRFLPVRWMSPESIMYGKFTTESDVWSFGVVLWEIYSFGKQPYYGHSNDEVIKLILQGILLKPPEGSSPTICHLMKGSWKTQPQDRLTFGEIHQKLVVLRQAQERDRVPLTRNTTVEYCTITENPIDDELDRDYSQL